MDTDPQNTHEPIVGIEKRDSPPKNRGMAVTPVVAEALENLSRKITVVPGTMTKISVFIFKHILTRGMCANMFGSMGIEAISKEML